MERTDLGKRREEKPLAQIIMAKPIKASFFKICVYRLSLPEGSAQEISIRHGKLRAFIVQE